MSKEITKYWEETAIDFGKYVQQRHRYMEPKELWIEYQNKMAKDVGEVLDGTDKNMNNNTLEKEKLQYKIKNGPRIESLVEYELQNGTIVAMFQGSRGSYPDLDFIVKYVDPGKRMRTPSHTHWIVDLLVKAEFNKEMVGLLCERYVEIYDIVTPFDTVDERNNYRLQYVEDTMNLFQDLDNHGYLSLEFIATIIELFILCEKRSDDAFMFKSLLQLVVDFCDDKRDFYQVVGYSKRV